MKLPNKIFGIETKGAYERFLARAEEKPEPEEPKVQTADNYWRIPDVEYRNEIYTVELAKSLLDNGSQKTQEQWAEYSEQARQKGDFYAGDMPLYHTLFTALFEQENSREREEARKFIQDSMRNHYYLTTLTRVIYQPAGKDKVIHNYKTKDSYELEADIAGPGREIETADSPALTALLGEGDIDKIKAIYNWINQTSTWILRVNSKPENPEERIAGFYVVSGGAFLICGRGPRYAGRALGVRAAKNL